MEFRNLNSFLRVAELGSFTKAAEELGYAQSTITSQIQQLEIELGAQLFERIGKRNVLTEVGQSLIPYANEILKLESKIQNLSHSPEAQTGSIRIGIVESQMVAVLLPILARFREQFPKVSVQIKLAHTADLIDLLCQNTVDIIVTMGHSGEKKDCVCVSSHTERAIFVAHKNHPLARQTSITAEELFHFPIILTGNSSFLQNELGRFAFQNKQQISSFLQAESSRLIIDLVLNDLGISFLPEYLVHATEHREKLSILKIKGADFLFHSFVYYHKNKWITPQMRGLIDLIDEQWAGYDAKYRIHP